MKLIKKLHKLGVWVSDAFTGKDKKQDSLETNFTEESLSLLEAVAENVQQIQYTPAHIVATVDIVSFVFIDPTKTKYASIEVKSDGLAYFIFICANPNKVSDNIVDTFKINNKDDLIFAVLSLEKFLSGEV